MLRLQDLQHVAVLFAQQVHLALHDGLAAERGARAARALDDVLHLHEREPARLRRQLVGGQLPRELRGLGAQVARKLGARGEVGARDRDDFRARRAGVHLVGDVLRRRGDEDDERPPRRDPRIRGPAGQRGDVLALGRAGSPRGSQGVRVVDHDRHRARGTALGREHRVEHDEGAGGIGGEQPLEAEGFAQRLLPVRVGKGQAGGHVVGGDDGAPPREALESFAQRHPIPTEDVEVAHVAVEQEEMARAGVVALEHARRQPRRDLQRLHGVSRRP